LRKGTNRLQTQERGARYAMVRMVWIWIWESDSKLNRKVIKWMVGQGRCRGSKKFVHFQHFTYFIYYLLILQCPKVSLFAVVTH